ncbi:hypothetical protein Pelo_1416 [Pelomyxa schiedti]|nr:hypothetical protein Pelo_1416 [Pelomyxa schiedti]
MTSTTSTTTQYTTAVDRATDDENAAAKCYVVAPSRDVVDRLVRAALAEGEGEGEEDAAATRRGGRGHRIHLRSLLLPSRGKGVGAEFRGCAQGAMKVVLVVCTPTARVFFNAIPDTLELLYGDSWAKNKATQQPFLFFVAGFDPDRAASRSPAFHAPVGLLECFAMASMFCADKITECTSAKIPPDVLREAHEGAKIGGFNTKTQFEPNQGANTAATGPESFRYSWTTRDSKNIISRAKDEIIIDIGYYSFSDYKVLTKILFDKRDICSKFSLKSL